MKGKTFVAMTGHDSGYIGHSGDLFVGSYDDCARHNHKFFGGYDFLLVDDKLADLGSTGMPLWSVADGEDSPAVRTEKWTAWLREHPDDSAFQDRFSDVVIHDIEGEKFVAQFMHCGGDGPTCYIREAQT